MLESWNEGTAKRAILDFLSASTTEGSPRFVPKAERIAAFDNDGTLWVEQPLPVQGPFLLAKLAARVRADPSLAETHPYKAILEKDQAFLTALAEQRPEALTSFLEAIGAAWEGTTPAQYDAEVRAYLAAHPDARFGRPATDLVYQPMRELVDALGAHGFRVFVCSAGGRDFMRVFAEETFGILKENIIGSAPEFEYRNGRLVRQAKLLGNLALGGGKPEQIFARTGRVARFASGNGDVDLEMLGMADFPLVIVHDDAEREYAYTQGAERLLATADQRRWTTVSMKNDWSRIFAHGDET